MQIGMIGLGRMGSNMILRLLADGHECVVYDQDKARYENFVAAGALAVETVQTLVDSLRTPRSIWLMLPVTAVDSIVQELTGVLNKRDIVIDGGNSYFRDSIRRAGQLATHDIAYVDVGTSGGVWGRERGYCLMIGGPSETIRHLEPIFKTLAPAQESVPETPGWNAGESTADKGYLHCGGHGAGHFVKMIHNGIEYGLMSAYAEGFAMLHKAGTDAIDPGPEQPGEPIRLDVATGEIAELWRRGSVIGSWLLDLAAQSLLRSSDLREYGSEVADSGAGRWAVKTATEMGIPAHVLTAALFERFGSRGQADYANRMLSALRFAFGGHDKQG